MVRVLLFLFLGLLGGCSRPVPPPLQPGDVVRPEVSFAPKAPWQAGAKIVIGMLLRGERPSGEHYYLNDDDLTLERAVMTCRISFWDGESLLAEPHEMPFVHDC